MSEGELGVVEAVGSGEAEWPGGDWIDLDVCGPDGRPLWNRLLTLRLHHAPPTHTPSPPRGRKEKEEEERDSSSQEAGPYRHSPHLEKDLFGTPF